jgi:hypothetical protein
MKRWFWYRNKIAESAKLIDFSATFLPSTLLSVALSDQQLNLTFCRQEIPRQNAHAAITQECAAELSHVAAKKWRKWHRKVIGECGSSQTSRG